MKNRNKFVLSLKEYLLLEENSNRVASATDILKKDYADVLEFTDKWFEIFGKPSPDFSMMFSGEPGSGKTSFLLEFAYYLASTFGKTLYISSEEFGSKTLMDKLKFVITKNIYKGKKVDEIEVPKNLFFAKGFTDLLDYDFIIIDSVTELDLDIQEFREIKDIYPDKAFVLVLQHTKAKLYRGTKEWEHEVSLYADIDKGIIDVKKNRYALKSCYDYFNNELISCQDEDMNDKNLNMNDNNRGSSNKNLL